MNTAVNERLTSGLRPLRWRWLWLGLGRFGIVLTIALSLLHLPDTGIDIEEGDKYGHALAYFTLVFWYGQLCATRRALHWRALGFLALGGAIEIAQSFTSYRTADWKDMLADALGVALAWGLALSPMRHGLSRLEAWWIARRHR
jgi:VanZ family protein